MTLFAICEGPSTSERVTTLFVLALVLMAAVAIGVFLFRSDRERWLIVATYVATAIVGALFTLVPGGISDQDADYTARFVLSLLVGTTVGLVLGFVRGRRLPSYTLAGLTGGGTFMVAGLGLFIGALAATGTCID